ncbi:MAG: FecR domain-containing protein [Flavitalea sp.]
MDKRPQNIEETVSNDQFLSWYFDTDTEKAGLWARRMDSDPILKKLSVEAAAFIASVRLPEKTVDAAAINRAKLKMLDKINRSSEASVIPIKRKRNNSMWIAAAAVVFIISCWGVMHYLMAEEPSFNTQFGEIKREQLPDGSEITLNADSRVSFADNWQKGGDREVWIKGEAFFKVQKTPEKSRFIVHTGHFDIEVTGTQFNVVSRNNKTNVLLKEGSIILKTENGLEKAMVPGDFVEYDNAKTLRFRTVKDAQVIAWKDRKFIFEKTSMVEVAAAITELYGVEVSFGDESVATESISGILPNDNLDIFLQSLNATQNFEAIKNNKRIVIRNRK